MVNATKKACAENGHELAGDSHEQREAEREIFCRLEQKLRVRLKPNVTLRVDGSAAVNVDAFCQSPPIFCEIYAHLGKLKGGQPKKVMTDALKLLYVSRRHRGSRRILVFADKVAARQFTSSRKWMGECLQAYNIEVLTISLSAAWRRKLQAAQVQQCR